MAERILIFGTTGVNKSFVCRKLETYQTNLYGKVNFQWFDFENFVLSANRFRHIYEYLDAKAEVQSNYWLEAWEQFKPEIQKHNDENIILSMHGVLARREYGTRTAIEINKILEDFKPTKIITLIQDVYLKWNYTQERAGEKRYIGKPTLEQLLQARRTEIFLGDLIAQQIDRTSPFEKHYVVSVWHPVRLLDRLAFRSNTLSKFYLSFPISTPRKWMEKDDYSKKDEIDTALKKVLDYESKFQTVAFFCPLTIDEYPLLNSTTERGRDEDGNEIDISIFNISNRWNVRNFYGEELLLMDDQTLPETINIPLEQVKDVAGMIRTDVGLRDYRLILQSNFLAVYNPIFIRPDGKVRISRGIHNEIRYATYYNKPLYVYQTPSYDPEHKLEHDLTFQAPSVGGGVQGSDYISIYHDLDEWLEAILEEIKKNEDKAKEC